MNLVVPLLIAIFGAAIYNVGAKQVPTNANPLHFLVLVYLAAALLSAVVGFKFSGESWGEVLKGSGGTIGLLALGVVCIEVGYILAYRAGGLLSLIPLTVSSGVLLVMLPVGAFLFHQQPSPRMVLGAVACLIGVALMTWK